MKHTKEPWIIEKKSLDPKLMGLEFPIQQRIAVIKTEDNFKIADVFDTAFLDLNEGQASLIACAPEMIEALEMVLADPIYKNGTGKTAIARLIKKAKGE